MDTNASYEVQIGDTLIEVRGADAYAPDGALTTFYRCRDGRNVVDVWATRVASFRTADITSILRLDLTPAWAP
jgi:proline racemase